MSESAPALAAASLASRLWSTFRDLGRVFEWALVSQIVLVALACHLWTINNYRTNPDLDSGFHLAQAAAMHQLLHAPGPFFEKLVAVWSWPSLYPQGQYLATAVWNVIFPVGSQGCLASLCIFIAVLAYGAYELGRQVGGPIAGFIAAILAVADPVILRAERRYWLDMPVAAMGILALALLLHSRNFTRRGPSIAFGAVLGFGVLVKFTMVWFLTAPLLWVAFIAVRDARPEDRKKLAIIAASVAAAYFALSAYSKSMNNHFVNYPVLVPASSKIILGAWVLVCGGWALATRKWLAGPLVNLSWSLCVSAAMAGPWVLVNGWFINMRWTPVAHDIPKNLRDFIPALTSFGDTVPWLLLLLSVVGMAALLLDEKRRRDIGAPLILAYFVGLFCTVSILPIAYRYTTPLGVLVAILAVGWLPRRAAVGVPLLLVSLAYMGFNLFAGRLPEASQRVDESHVTGFQEASILTGRTFADVRDAEHSDVEPDATRLIDAAGDARVACLIADARRVNDYTRMWYVAQAVAGWKARLLSVRFVRPDVDGAYGEATQDPVAPAFMRTLASWRGRNPLEFPAFGPIEEYHPEVIAMPSDMKSPEKLAATLFGAPYKLLPGDSGSLRILKRDNPPGSSRKE